MPEPGAAPSDAWAGAHRAFHRALLEGCGNPVILDTFDRLWTLSELARSWSVVASPRRDVVGEHQQLERLALECDGDAAAHALADHIAATVAVLAE